ncbi:hypothetical protein TEA_025079 [Camellia sinensis var. sinensis]|uniref:Splicing factor cactin central domain-containing protein n=1 Tax=Camellia sinensis var. sinensis TaxID=542762 RepID=A0A4S4E457_CAMSN|nr:hypothetical protein TEA_025079 [Camellia sinensis var. sinensis]
METHGSSKTKSKRKREASSSKTSQSRSRSRRKSDDDDDSETDSRGSLTPSHHRSHKRSLSRRSASRDSDDSDDGSDLERKRKRSSSKKVTDEDIADYLAKKAQKKALKVAKKLKSQTVSGYSNDANPFGDSNLNEKFVWRKKIEKDISQGVPLDMFSIKAEKKKQRERMAEIEKVKKRREERAIEKAQHEEEMALLARERARAEFQDWEKKEEEFHFDQSKVRSEIRLREGRTKPIDILSKQLNPLDDFDIEINEPYMVLKLFNLLDSYEKVHAYTNVGSKKKLVLDFINIFYYTICLPVLYFRMSSIEWNNGVAFGYVEFLAKYLCRHDTTRHGYGYRIQSGYGMEKMDTVAYLRLGL